MRKLLRILSKLTALVVLLVGGLVGFVQFSGVPSYPRQAPELKIESTPERVARGRKIAAALIGSPHRLAKAKPEPALR